MEKLILIILLTYSFCKIDKVEEKGSHIDYLEKYGKINVGRGLGMFYLNVEDFDIDDVFTINFSPRFSIEENYLKYDFTDTPPQNLLMNLTYYSTVRDYIYDDGTIHDWDYYEFTKKENKKFMVVRFTAIKDEVSIKHFNEELSLTIQFIVFGLIGLGILILIIYCIYKCCKK